MSKNRLVGVALGLVALLVGSAAAGAPGRVLGHDAMVRHLWSSTHQSAAAASAHEVAVPKAPCAPGSAPERALQGEVPQADRDSGRSLKPYTCNLRQISAPLGEGAGLQAAYYKHCAYYGVLGTGTRVVDVSNPAKPTVTETLTSPAMLDPWESLKVNAKRGLLGAVEGTLDGPVFFDVYDVSKDCAHPVKRSSLPINSLGHEGEWSQDGTIYYSASMAPGLLTAIDVRDPALPKIITVTTYTASGLGHGFSTNASGTRLYAVDPDAFNAQGRGQGLEVLDVTAIKDFQLAARPKVLGSVYWPDGGGAQHTIPITYHGKQFVAYADELGYGAVRILDVSNERKPRIVSVLRTQIQLAQNRALADAEEGASPNFAYNTHYCNVDRLDDPTVIGCSTRASGLRVFDIRNPLKPREIAYFNPGGTAAGKSGSMTAQVHFVPERGEVWSTDGGKGFFVLRFAPGVWKR